LQELALIVRTALLSVALGLALGSSLASAEVMFDWVRIGDHANSTDDTGFGAVADVYRISKFETTNSQYVDFLNAVAASDPNGLYNTMMAVGFGGITRGGISGSFTYSARTGRENWPVNFVSF
jgi:hypothetical protein